MKRARIIRAIATLISALCVAATTAYAQGAGIEWETLYDEALELYKAGKYDLAATLAEKALQVAEENVGPMHLDVGASLNLLGSIYHAQGDYAKAEPLYKRSLAIREKTLGPEHPDVATVLEHLAALYRATNRAGEAEELERRAAAPSSSLMDKHGRISQALGAICVVCRIQSEVTTAIEKQFRARVLQAFADS